MSEMNRIRRQMRGPDASEARAALDAERKQGDSAWGRMRRTLGYGRRRIDVTVQEQFNSAWFAMALLITLLGLVARIPELMAIAATLLTLVAASWLWNRLAFAHLTYERTFSERRAFQGETITLELTLANHKLLPLPWVTTADTFPRAIPVEDASIIIRGDTGKGELNLFWPLKWYDAITRTYRLRAATRGFHTFGPVTIQTGDGFGMFRSSRRVETTHTLIVYPRVLPITHLGLPAKNPYGDQPVREFMFEDPLRTVGVRDYRPEDDFRKVHWKASARRGELQTRVLEPSHDHNLMICVNVLTVEKSWMGVIPEHLEQVVSIAASIAYDALLRRRPAGVLANGALPGSDQPIKLLPGRSPAQLTAILELLAAVTPFATAPFEALLARESPRLPWGGTLVVITSTVPESLAATLLELKATGRRLVLITLDHKPLPEGLSELLIYRVPAAAMEALDLGQPFAGADQLLTPDQRQRQAILNLRQRERHPSSSLPHR
jgi:uncharacterized protein (DUF58 family)